MPGTVVVFDRFPGIFCLLSVAHEAESSIVWTNNESEALRSVCELTPDMVVLGVAPPSVEWRPFFQAVRAKAPACAIIGVASPEQASVVRHFAELGVDRMFWRATEVGDLLRRVSATLLWITPTRLPWAVHNPHVDRALTYLAMHFSGRVTLADVARPVGVSISHLAHVFVAAAGMTLREYVLRLKIELTKRLLLASRSTLEVLADECGFCDASHLSRVFRQHVGCWPGEFRAQFARSQHGLLMGRVPEPSRWEFELNDPSHHATRRAVTPARPAVPGGAGRESCTWGGGLYLGGRAARVVPGGAGRESPR